MARTSRHSKACERCRSRRLRCDFRRPACSQCTNAGIVCAGYRNEQDLLFRDETAAVTAKLADHRPKSREESASMQSTSSPAQPLDLHTPDSSLVGQTGTVEDKALDHLLNYYLRRSSFQYVTEMYSSTKPGSLFHQTVRATALAAYSHEIDEPDLLDQARHMYGNALIQLGETLTTLDTASDETLATVLLMSRFETLAKTADGDSMSETWSNHVVGAFELVNTDRAEGCFPNHYSLILVEQTVHNYNLYCLKVLKRRPAPLLDLSEQLAICGGSPHQAKTNHLRLKLHIFTDAFCPFTRSRKSHGTDDSYELLQWARSLDDQCVGFMEELAAESKYEIIDKSTLSTPPGHGLITHDGTYHIYYDHYEARIWNGMRMLRLSLNEAIYSNAKNLRESLEYPDSPQHAEFEDLMTKCGQHIQRLAEEICASAPQFLQDKDHPDCTPAAGCFLAWPLYIAGKIASERCGDYVKERLRWIGRELKIQAAFIAADDLKTTGYQDDWLYACYMF